MTLRSLIQSHHKTSDKEYESLRDMYASCISGGGFLLPESYEGCIHQTQKRKRCYMNSHDDDAEAGAGGGTIIWIALESGFCICSMCGEMHICCRGACPDVPGNCGERVCLISGYVTCEYEKRPERNAMDRCITTPATTTTIIVSAGGSNTKTAKKNNIWSVVTSDAVAAPQQQQAAGGGIIISRVGCTGLWETVQGVVQELLASDKTHACAREEKDKCEGKEQTLFCRILRDMAQSNKTSGARANMVCIIAQVAYGCRKHRRVEKKEEEEDEMMMMMSPTKRKGDIKDVIEKCTESITRLIVQHGWLRVGRHIQNHTRGREFITSMLYLMRMGITFQKRQILPKMPILNQLLPMQALLPSVFKIRAKSITEGENIIKLDIRRIPL